MQIKIQTQKLLKILKNISGGIKKTKKNALSSYILIKTIKKNIFCVSINEDIEIVTYDTLEKNDNDAEILIKHDLIYNICRTNKEDSIINIIQKHNSVEVQTENSTFNLPYINNQIFPSFPHEENTLIKFKIKTNLLKNLLQKSIITTADNSPKLFLNGILFNINKNKLNILSSDGFRIIYSYELIKNNTKKIKVIIPKNTINEIINIFNNEDYTIILISNNQIKFITTNITLTSRLVNDIYNHPKIKISSSKNKIIQINTADMKNALNKINVLCTNNSKVNFLFQKKQMTIKTKNNYEHVNINLKNDYNKNQFKIDVNYKYFIDIIKLIENEYFYILINLKEQKIIIKEEYKNYIYIIMPFNI